MKNRGKACAAACGGPGYCLDYCGEDGMCCSKGQGIAQGCDENISVTDYLSCGPGGSEWHGFARGVPAVEETVYSHLPRHPGQGPVTNKKQKLLNIK